MTRKGLGMTVIADQDNRVVGVFTDGDLRRTLDRRIDIHGVPMRDVMTRGCKTIQPGLLAAEALHLMETHKITALPVVDAERRLLGVLHMHAILQAGVA